MFGIRQYLNNGHRIATFDITPHLWPADPWIAQDGVEFAKRIYDEKHRIANLLRPSSIVEIGVRAGYTASTFLAVGANSYQGFDADIQAFGGNFGAFQWTQANLSKRFPQPDIQLKTLNTQQVDCLPAQGPVELVIVDGDHSYEGARHDLNLALGLNPDWILLDDVTYDLNVRRAAADFLDNHPAYHGILFPTVRGDLLLQKRNL